MAKACLFIGWDKPRVGRETEATKWMMGEAAAQVEKFQKEGFCETFDILALTPHCANLNFMILLKGERAKLDELRRTDAFERFSMQLMMSFDGYGVVPGVTLEGMKGVTDRNPDLLK